MKYKEKVKMMMFQDSQEQSLITVRGKQILSSLKACLVNILDYFWMDLAAEE